MEIARSPTLRFADAIVSVLLAAVAVVLVFADDDRKSPYFDAFGALFFFYLALLMACAYASPQRLYILRALAFVAEYLSYPRGRYMALVYSVVSFGIAAYYLVHHLNAG